MHLLGKGSSLMYHLLRKGSWGCNMIWFKRGLPVRNGEFVSTRAYSIHPNNASSINNDSRLGGPRVSRPDKRALRPRT